MRILRLEATKPSLQLVCLASKGERPGGEARIVGRARTQRWRGMVREGERPQVETGWPHLWEKGRQGQAQVFGLSSSW